MKIFPTLVIASATVISAGLTLKQASATNDLRKATAMSNIKQLELATIMYSTDCDDFMPKGKTLSQVKSEIMPYCKNSKIFVSQNPKGGQIQYNANLAAVSMTEIQFPSDAPVFYDSKAWPDGGRPVSFADGHAKFTTTQTWKAVAKELKRKYKHAKKGK